MTFADLAVKNLFTTSSVVVGKEVADAVGAFDPEVRGPEDYGDWLRCVRVARAVNLEAPLIGYRTVAGSLGKRSVIMEAGMLRILQKLDQAGAWQGRWPLRRKAYGYTYYSCAYMYAAAGEQGKALRRMLRSVWRYPLPLGRSEVRMGSARPRW